MLTRLRLRLELEFFSKICHWTDPIRKNPREISDVLSQFQSSLIEEEENTSSIQSIFFERNWEDSFFADLDLDNDKEILTWSRQMSVQIIVLEWVNAILGISTDEILLHQGTLEICSMKQSCLLNIDLLDLFHHFCLFTLFDHFIADLDQISSLLQLWDHFGMIFCHPNKALLRRIPLIQRLILVKHWIDLLLVPSSFDEIELINVENWERGIKRSEVVVHSLDQRWLNAENGSGTVDDRLRENLFNL